MTRHQVINTRHLDNEDVRLFSAECPNCGIGNAFEVGQTNACGAKQCYNCGNWFQYEEDYEELPE